MTVDDLKDWIRENLILEVSYTSDYSSSNDVYVSLRLHGEVNPFVKELIYIPPDNE